MSPEQAMGQSDRIGPWTDVFGLGGLLYHLLTLGPLYRGASETSVVRQARGRLRGDPRSRPVRRPEGWRASSTGPWRPSPNGDTAPPPSWRRALRGFLARRRIAAVVLAIVLAASTSRWRSHSPGSSLHGRGPRDPPSGSPDRRRSPCRSPRRHRLEDGRPRAVPRVLSFRVDAFRVEPPENLGSIGVSPAKVRVDDEVEVSARFDATMFGYLIALDPDGRVQLCQPLEESEPPSGSEEIRIHESKAYALTGRPGLQAFVVVASRKPLPPYEKWRGAEGLRRLWKPCDDATATAPGAPTAVASRCSPSPPGAS